MNKTRLKFYNIGRSKTMEDIMEIFNSMSNNCEDHDHNVSNTYITDLTDMKQEKRSFDCKIVRIGDIQMSQITPIDKCNFKVYLNKYKHGKEVQLVKI